MIDEARIESDERGFELVLAGDFSEAIARYIAGSDGVLALRLPQDAAITLAAAVRAEIDPWVDEMEFHQASYQAASLSERAAVLRLPDDLDDGYEPGNPKHAGFREALLDAADLERKRRKEER